ncbi:hypothetical protein D0Y65_012468 [Glycine soja]|uniref:Uncharacterized protein n=1 Tax=Glycine soja TaxID=3848 RepID=A0A445KP69_GLYSO|nr:hypothetical protein D0Y65_012468 [Glycine soja]
MVNSKWDSYSVQVNSRRKIIKEEKDPLLFLYPFTQKFSSFNHNLLTKFKSKLFPS